MQDEGKTKEQFLVELHELRKRISEIERDQAVIESRNYLRTILQAMPDGFLVGDAERKITEANEAYCRMSGYSLAELLSLNLSDIDAVENPVSAAARRKRIIDKGSETFETCHRRKDGSIFDVEVSATYSGMGGGRTVCFCRDITERKRAEAALAESEQRFSLAMEATKDGLWDWNLHTDEVYYSPGYLTMLGYSPCEVPANANTWADRIHPEDKDAALKANMDSIDNRRDDFEVEFRMQAKNGEWRWILERGKPAGRDENGRAVRMVGTHTDITDRKRGEDALKEREEMYRTLVSLSPDAISVVDTNGSLILTSPRAIQLFGDSPDDDILGRSLLDWVAPEEQEKASANIEHLLTEGTLIDSEYTLIKKDGTRFIGEVNAAAIHSPEGSPMRMIIITRDVTERKRAEESLRNSHSLLAATLESTADGILVVDTAGKVNSFNRSFLKLWRIPETLVATRDDEQLLQFVLDQLLDPDVFLAKVRKLYRTPDASSMDELVFKDGRIFERYSQPQRIDDKIVGRVWSFRDITERKRGEEERKKLEEQLFHAQKMESVGRLAGGVAHDFNNMLGVIIGRAEMGLNNGALTDELDHNLKEILNAGLRSADLTRQLLAFARKQTAVPKILDLNDTISGMLKMLRRLIAEDIGLSWQPGLDLWKVKIDPSQVDQILANLVVNARDAISGVGAITMRTENVVIDDSITAETPEFIPGKYVLLTVRDTGTGMSQEVRKNIFEPFFTTKEVGKGTGLGLATVYGIVKQNQGFISVNSELGKGTTFKIYLPRFGAGTAQVPLDEAAVKRRTGTETILLVEDDEAILDLNKMILEKLGYTVLAAQTPVHAMHLAKDHPGELHLLLTDVVMPEMHGRALAEQLGILRPSLKFLFMSGYTADVITHQGILDDGVNFIQKPFGIDELAARVRRVLDHLE